MPFLVLVVAGAGFFVGSSQRALNSVVNQIRAFVPINAGFLRVALNRISLHPGFLGLIGLLGLLYAAHQIFLAMTAAMNIIWNIPEHRSWLRRRAIAMAATLLSLGLMGADLAVTWALTQARHFGSPMLVRAVASGLLAISAGVIPLLLSATLFTILYRLLPARPVPAKPALTGATVAAVLWQITKLAFGAYLLRVHSYDRLYGPLSGVVILVVWSFYTMAILLLGAEIAADAAPADAHPAAQVGAAGTSG